MRFFCPLVVVVGTLVVVVCGRGLCCGGLTTAVCVDGVEVNLLKKLPRKEELGLWEELGFGENVDGSLLTSAYSHDFFALPLGVVRFVTVDEFDSCR